MFDFVCTPLLKRYMVKDVLVHVVNKHLRVAALGRNIIIDRRPVAIELGYISTT